MKKLLLTMAAIPALTLAMPAASQVNYNARTNYNAYGDSGLRNRIIQMSNRIDAGLQAGTITRNESRMLRIGLRDLTRLETQYSRNGLTNEERRDLQMRLRNLRRDIQVADGRRDGRWDNDDYYGQGGPLDAEFDGWRVDEDCDGRSSGIGRIISGLIGNNSCMRVGDRVRGNLFAVPYQYRTQFRDRNGIYYRTDGRDHVYEIDARTNTIIRVWERDD